ncbi:MAG: DUF6680 family protein [Pseudomonadota bacterium]
MSTTDIVVIVAAVVGALVGAVVSILWQYRDRQYDRRLNIFRAMMELRASPVHASFVNSFNAIPIEFYGVKNVIDKWDALYRHFGTKMEDEKAWATTRIDLMVDLLHSMSQKLGYKFDPSQLKAIYSPVAHGNREDMNAATRIALADLLHGHRTLRLEIANWPDNMGEPQAVDPQKK